MVPNWRLKFVVASPEHKSADTEADLACAINEPLLLTYARLVNELVN